MALQVPVKFVGVEYNNSQIVKHFFSLSAADVLGRVEEQNAINREYGWAPSWSAYLVQGDDWLKLDNYIRSETRYDFVLYLDKLNTTPEEWGM